MDKPTEYLARPVAARATAPVAASAPRPRGDAAGSTVVLTGGGGFIGGHVRAALAGREVVLLGRRRPAALGSHERWARVDLAAGTPGALVTRSIEALDVPAGTALCHLAHDVGDPKQAVTMSLNLLAAVNTCPQITRVALVSTVSVYGPSHRGLVDETTACRPRSAYARSKLAAERPWLTALRADCELMVLRMGSVISARRPASYQPIFDALRRPLRAAALGSLRQGTPVSYVTAGNAAAAIQFALDTPQVARRATFNVVDDLGGANAALARANVNYAAMQDTVRALAGLPALWRFPLPVAAVDGAARVLRRPRPGQWYSSAALRAAGFCAPYTLADEIARIVDGHLPDRARAGSVEPGGDAPCGC
ncbi:NAD-dependent epimerase/dehydratase family protein [Pseudofrankia inefficax]|uniref:NAD-dependent epimerase/dehydratase family protein n=1 Tax=Pseudofrankia inefficax (strain DSM 45817 / CECT 9037 / DDB 130130 / EuI1c) TaxID=298654 RepID=UPI0002FF3D73|nr:NAD-dependent epimerase/dehydratase family protein [Pseudofrankia inefficax]